jgi:hypothetical protein
MLPQRKLSLSDTFKIANVNNRQRTQEVGPCPNGLFTISLLHISCPRLNKHVKYAEDIELSLLKLKRNCVKIKPFNVLATTTVVARTHTHHHYY